MPKYVCRTETWWAEKLWAPGDIYEASPEQTLQKDRAVLGPTEIPRHFDPVAEPVAVSNKKGKVHEEY